MIMKFYRMQIYRHKAIMSVCMHKVLSLSLSNVWNKLLILGKLWVINYSVIACSNTKAADLKMAIFARYSFNVTKR